MAELKAFVLWFLDELPAFLLTPPISLFVGFGLLAFTIVVIKSIINLNR